MAKTKVKSRSPDHRFVIALHSPSGIDESGLSHCPLEKTARKLASGYDRTFSPVRFELGICGIAGISDGSERNAAWILCTPDCVAETGGFEPSVQV